MCENMTYYLQDKHAIAILTFYLSIFKARQVLDQLYSQTHSITLGLPMSDGFAQLK